MTNKELLNYEIDHYKVILKNIWNGFLSFLFFFFAVEHVKQVTHLETYNAMFQEKGGGFVNIYLNSLDSVRGQRYRSETSFVYLWLSGQLVKDIGLRSPLYICGCLDNLSKI